MPFTGSYEEILRSLGNPQQGTYSNGVYIAPAAQQQVPGSYDPPGAGGSPLPAAATPYDQLVRILANVEAGAITPDQAATELQAILAPLGQYTPQELPQVAAAWVEQAQREGTQGIMSVLASDPGWRAALQIPPEIDYGALVGGVPGGGQAGGGQDTLEGGIGGYDPLGSAPPSNLADPYLEQELTDPAGVFSRYIQGLGSYKGANPAIRNLMERKGGEQQALYDLYTAGSPERFSFLEGGETAQPFQSFQNFLSGNQQPTQGQARGGLESIRRALGLTNEEYLQQSATNPFLGYARERYLDESGNENALLRNALAQSQSLGLNPILGAYTSSAASNAFRRWQQANPKQSLLTAAKGWGWY